MADSRYGNWAQMVASGSADSFFATYPSDEELAEKLNGFLPGSGQISVEQIKRDRQRFDRLPRRGNNRDDKFASPTKHVILNKARQLKVPEALAEILDNVFDNFERNSSRPKKLEVEIIAYAPIDGASPGELIINENSGGIPNDRLVPLVRLGASDKAAGGIGAWGEGFKMAVFALGQEVEVFSTFPKERPVAIHFPKGWLDPTDRLWEIWKVESFEIQRNAPSEGTTVIRVNYLHNTALQYLGLGKTNKEEDARIICEELAVYFGEVYAEKYQNLVSQGFEVLISLNIGGYSQVVTFMEPVEIRLRQNLSFLPWLRPIRWHKTWVIPLEDEKNTSKLEVTIYAGMAATENYSPAYSNQLQSPGVEMWGNGRKFSLKGRITDESVGWGFTYGGKAGRNPTSNSSYRRLTIVALFEAEDSRDIPWAAPVKNDYNRRSNAYAEIKETIARVIRLFKDTAALLEFALLPFSFAWTTFDTAAKLAVLFSDTNATGGSLSGFEQSRFGKKLLAFQPSLSFREIIEDDPTVHSLYGLETTQIRDLVAAAVASKQSAEQRIRFLKAVFPNLAKQADLEEQVGLNPDEEIDL
jgi:hypothetical protein